MSLRCWTFLMSVRARNAPGDFAAAASTKSSGTKVGGAKMPAKRPVLLDPDPGCHGDWDRTAADQPPLRRRTRRCAVEENPLGELHQPGAMARGEDPSLVGDLARARVPVNAQATLQGAHPDPVRQAPDPGRAGRGVIAQAIERIPWRGIAGPPEHEIELRVVGAGDPGRAAAVGGGVTGPGSLPRTAAAFES